jgi:hypothetical protein
MPTPARWLSRLRAAAVMAAFVAVLTDEATHAPHRQGGAEPPTPTRSGGARMTMTMPTGGTTAVLTAPPPATTSAREALAESPCRICGCTDDTACPGGCHVDCHWVPDPTGTGVVCSECRDVAAAVLGLDDVDPSEVDARLAALANPATAAIDPARSASAAGGRVGAVLAAAVALLVSRGRHRGDWTGEPDGTGPCCLNGALRIAAGGDPHVEPDPYSTAGRLYYDAVATLADRALPPSEAASDDLYLQESRLAGWNDQRDDDTVFALLAETLADLTRCAGAS